MAVINPILRQLIYDRDGNACLKCGFNDVLTIDHILPISCGGNNKRENLQTLCDFCNQEKADTYADYREWPEFEQEEKFDWTLNVRDLEYKYGDKKREKRVAKIAAQLGWPKEPINYLWDGKTNVEKPVKQIPENHVIYKDRKCLVYGSLIKAVGYGSLPGQHVYYDNVEEKLLLNNTGTLIAYHIKTIIDHVSVTGGVPNLTGIKQSQLKEKAKLSKLPTQPHLLYNFSELYTKEEQCNFHYE